MNEWKEKATAAKKTTDPKFQLTLKNFKKVFYYLNSYYQDKTGLLSHGFFNVF